ncbi:MAG: DNA-binding protein Alba [Candidatus Aenigmarchaeota archaeon]|nr:DNA-binding protein Alba [Candidatus Aenigmarchaeota archaeon]
MAEGQRVLNQVLKDSARKQVKGKEKAEEKKEEQKEEQKEAKSELEAETQVQEEVTQEDSGALESQEEKQDEAPRQEPAREGFRKPDFRRQPDKKPRRGAAPNVVFVGKKPTMSYVLAVVTQFSDGMENVHIKARGRSISRAVDVAEVVRNRFVQGAKIDVQIGTDEVIDDNSNKINVSTIDIQLNK